MKILAIDPGYTESAWVLYDTETRLPVSWVKEPNACVVTELRATVADVCVIEMIASYGMAVGKEIFESCVWIGRFAQVWDDRDAALLRASYFQPRRATLTYRREVKLHICASPRANDSTIRQALIDRYGPSRQVAVGRKASPGPLYGFKADCWQALALAITHAETCSVPEALAV